MPAAVRDNARQAPRAGKNPLSMFRKGLAHAGPFSQVIVTRSVGVRCSGRLISGGTKMRIGSFLLCAGAELSFTAAYAASTYEGNGQVPQQFVLSGKAADRLHDHMSINADTAEKLSKACEAIARRNNSQVVVVVLNPQGLVVHEHRMDGEGWIQVKATEQKALTALRTRAASHALTNRNVQDPFTNQNMSGDR